MKRVLVTGATGFIGRHTLAPLRACAGEVHAVSSSGPPAGWGGGEGVRWHVTDLLAPESAALVSEIAPTHLLHLAWYTAHGRFWSSAENLRWVAATLRLMQAFAEGGGERAVVAGTCAEYEWQRATHCVEALTPLLPATLYGAAKHATHIALASYGDTASFELAWGRIFFAFGPYENPRRLVGSLASALVAGRPADCSDGEQVRDFLYAPDLASAFVALLGSGVQGAVNMASGVPLRVRELVELVGAVSPHPELLRIGALAADRTEPESLTADVTRLRDEVKWTPSVDLRRAVQETVDWWLKERG